MDIQNTQGQTMWTLNMYPGHPCPKYKTWREETFIIILWFYYSMLRSAIRHAVIGVAGYVRQRGRGATRLQAGVSLNPTPDLSDSSYSHKPIVAHNHCLPRAGEKITQVHLKHPPSNCRFIHDYAKLFRMEISHVKLRSWHECSGCLWLGMDLFRG